MKETLKRIKADIRNELHLGPALYCTWHCASGMAGGDD